jgi:hypothetical protein
VDEPGELDVIAFGVAGWRNAVGHVAIPLPVVRCFQHVFTGFTVAERREHG